MIAAPRRFKCFRCSRVQSFSGELPPTISCSECKGPVLEIDKLGNALPLTLDRAPAIERPQMTPELRQHVDAVAARLLASIGE